MHIDRTDFFFSSVQDYTISNQLVEGRHLKQLVNVWLTQLKLHSIDSYIKCS